MQDCLTRSGKIADLDSRNNIQRMIIEFLDLPKPILQEPLAKVLQAEGMVEFYVSQITRCGPETFQPSTGSDQGFSPFLIYTLSTSRHFGQRTA